MEGTYTKNGWQQTNKKKKLNYKPEGRRNIGRPQTRSGDDFWEEGTGPGAKPYSWWWRYNSTKTEHANLNTN